MKGKDIYERFVSKIDKAGEDSCWLWNSSRTTNGYGAFFTYENGRDKPTHHQASRLSWELFRGPIPEGIFVLHTCDIRHCVNPNHLFLGTPKDNTQDMIKKSRGPQCQPKLTFEQAEEVRRLYKTGTYTYAQLAKMFSVSTTPIQKVIGYAIHKPPVMP